MSSAVLLSVLALGPLPWTGWAYCYHPGVFANVARARAISVDWSVDGYASTPRCAWVGGYLQARVAGQPVLLQVLDCSDPADLPHQLRPRGAGGLGLVLEVDWTLAHTQGWATYAGATGPGRAPATVYAWTPTDPRARARTLTVSSSKRALADDMDPTRPRARALAAAHTIRDERMTR